MRGAGGNLYLGRREAVVPTQLLGIADLALTASAGGCSYLPIQLPSQKLISAASHMAQPNVGFCLDGGGCPQLGHLLPASIGQLVRRRCEDLRCG